MYPKGKQYISFLRRRPIFFSKINPLAILETDAGIGFIGEYKWNKSRMAVQLELQPIFFSPYERSFDFGRPNNSLDASQPLGIEIRPEFKYYFKEKKPGKDLLYYVSFDLLYKHVDTKRIGNFRVSNGGTSTFNQIATYNDIKRVIGFDFKFGQLIHITDDEHWYIEPYIGFGIRSKSFSYRNIPLGASEPSRNFNFGDGASNNITGISLPGSVRVVYRF